MDYKKLAAAALDKRTALVEELKTLAGVDTDEARAAIETKEVEVKALLDEARSYADQSDEEDKAIELRNRVNSISVVKNEVRKSDDSEDAQLRSILKTGGAMEFRTAPVVGGGKNYTNGALVTAFLEAMANKVAVFRAGAEQIRTSGDGPINAIALETDTAALVAEGAAISETTDNTQKTLTAYKYAKIANISRELADDAAADVAGLVGRRLGRRVAEALNVDLLVGDGSSKPRGVRLDSALGSNAAVGALTDADIYDLYYSVDDRAQNGTWVMNGTTATVLRTTSSSLWTAGVGTDNPDLLLGRPVIVDSNMAAIGASAKSVLFGDFSEYIVRLVDGLRIEVSTDYKFGNDLVSVRAILRGDGILADTTAVKHVLHAAS